MDFQNFSKLFEYSKYRNSVINYVYVKRLEIQGDGCVKYRSCALINERVHSFNGRDSNNLCFGVRVVYFILCFFCVFF